MNEISLEKPMNQSANPSPGAMKAAEIIASWYVRTENISETTILSHMAKIIDEHSGAKELAEALKDLFYETRGHQQCPKDSTWSAAKEALRKYEEGK